MSRQRKVSTTVYLSVEQVDALEKVSKKTHIPQSVIIRRGVSMALKDMGVEVSE